MAVQCPHCGKWLIVEIGEMKVRAGNVSPSSFVTHRDREWTLEELDKWHAEFEAGLNKLDLPARIRNAYKRVISVETEARRGHNIVAVTPRIRGYHCFTDGSKIVREDEPFMVKLWSWTEWVTAICTRSDRDICMPWNMGPAALRTLRAALGCSRQNEA